MPEPTQPRDFDPIFSQGVVIVGGHAVNLWASFYAGRGDQILAGFEPFTSKDADIFLRDRELALAVAAAAGWKFRANPEPRSPVLGVIMMNKDGSELQVDVLRSVTGLTDDEMAVTESITFANGKNYSVPAPDVMLKGKLANLAIHDQKARQDERHIRILTRCCAHYLADASAAVRAGTLSDREAVERFMATQRVIMNRQAQQLEKKFALGLSAAIPARDMLGDAALPPRLRAFYEHQVERERACRR